MNKLLVSDYDGTFYTNDEDIVKNIEAVKKFRDDRNIFIFATGRSYSDFKTVQNKYNLEYDYLILNHGASILDKDDNLLSLHVLETNHIEALISELHIGKSISHFFCSAKSDRAGLNDENLIKISVKYADTNLLKEINGVINKNYKNIYNSYMASEHTLEIVSNGSSKLLAIDFIKKRLNIKDDYIYTIGNGDSDIEMINRYNGFIMGSYKSVHQLINDIMNERI